MEITFHTYQNEKFKKVTWLGKLLDMLQFWKKRKIIALVNL